MLCEELEALSVSYLHRLHADLRVVLLGLQFQLHIEQRNLGILVAFRLHLKTSVGEGFFESNSRNQLRVLWNLNGTFNFQGNSYFIEKKEETN